MRNKSFHTILKTIYNHFLCRTFILWMAVFFLMRLFFVCVNYNFLQGSFGHKMMLFVAALRLDVATAVFLISPVFILWLIYVFYKRKWLFKTISSFNLLLLVIVILLSSINVVNYTSWQSVISKRILMYIQDPLEISKYMSTLQIVLSLLGLVLMIGITVWCHQKFVAKQHEVNSHWKSAAIHFSLLPLFVLLMRGGFQVVPINESSAYYSIHQSNDHAAVNPIYYFGHSISELYFDHTKFEFMPHSKEKELMSQLMLEQNSDTLVLTNVDRPNLVIVILESWTADIMEELGGETGVTPYTSELAKESFLFTKCYGSGFRTDQGLVSILSGYPAQPDNSIMIYPDKIKNVPSICQYLNHKNYSSSFFSGADLTFAKFKSFLVQQGFNYISDRSNYNAKDYNSKWGAHDDKVFTSQLNHLKTIKEPFFSCVLTLSTHEPFEIPVAYRFGKNNLAEKFKSSAYYTDQCLKNYFQEVKKTKWYKNTLFLLVADHGHSLPRGREMNSPASKRIVCLLAGGALNPSLKGKQWNSVLGQHDLVRMLAPYFKYKPNAFTFSKDPFKSVHPFAYYTNEDILVLLTDTSEAVYEIRTKNEYGTPLELNYAKAYLQWVYNDFRNR